MDIKEIARNLHPLERKVVPFLEISKDLKSLAESSGMKEVEIMRALQWLSNKEVLKIHESEKDIIELGKNGKLYREKGLPERRFLNVIKEFELPISKIVEKADLHPSEVNICIGTLKSKAAINIRKDGEMIISITDPGKAILSKETLEEKFLKKEFPLNMDDLKEEEKFACNNLKKRKEIIELNIIKTKSVELLPLGKELLKIKLTGQNIIDKLTPQMLKSKSWKKKEFRGYDVSINVPKVYGGKRHFVNQAVDYIKKIWLEMGFVEMTGNMI